MKKILSIAGLFLAAAFSQVSALAAPLSPAIPPNIVTSTPRPMIMLNMSKDHQLFYRAYDEFSDLDGDGLPETTYKHSFNYYGYFDSYKCYSYSGTTNRFDPVSTNTNKYCTGNWSGNFLNWATMTRVDVVRKVLYGGQRVTDTAALTVLERASLPTDAHSFAKYYKGEDLAQLTPFSASQLAASATISNNDNNNARRQVRFVAASNKAYRNNDGNAPSAATSATCESKAVAYYAAQDPPTTPPPEYHCVTHSVTLSGAFTIEVGDQVRAVDQDNAARYMEGVALEVNTTDGWFNMVVTPSGYVTPGSASSNFKKWTIQNLTQTSATICNTTLGDNLTANAPFNTNTAGNGNSHTNANPPLMRIARGDYQLWNANERWQCHWSGEKSASNGNNVGVTGLGAGSSNPTKGTQGVVVGGNGPDFIVRVSACNSTLLGSENCKQYPSGNFKPQGLLHEYGEGNLAEFGLMTGSFAKNISGGVLRSNIDSFRSEVNYTTDGTFTAAQGIVYTLNKLRIYGYRYSDGTYIGDGNCTYQLTSLTDNQCTSWGNPMGEMFTESLRYLGGLAPSSIYDYTQSGSKDEAMGLPKPAWIDPVNRANAAAKTAADATFGQGQCRAINAINFNSSVTSYDSNTGTQWSPFATLPTSPSLVNMINVIGTDEGIHNNSWFIGSNGTTNDGTCTAKTISTLASANGLCPDAPSYAGSYALAGAAYWARTNPVRTPTAAQLKANADAFKVKSFSVALAPGKPRIEIPHPTVAGQKIVLQPSYQLLVGGGIGSGTLVDFRVVGTPTATSGKFLIVWEDSEQGGDYDSDVSGILRYEVIDNKLYVYTRVFNAASANPQGFGYTLSGSTKDGAHFHSGIYGYNFTDGTTLSVKRADGTAHPNVNTSGGCSGCQANQDESRAEYTFGTATAGQLQDPLWYAAKWGGFSKNENVTVPPSDPKVYFEKPTADKANWDTKKLDGTSGTDGFPDNYFLAIRPSELEKALRAAFSAIVGASNTAPAVASAQIQSGSLKYLASFDGDDGHGELLTFIVKPDGKFDIRLKTDGTLDREYYYWAAHTKLTALPAASRQIITNVGNSSGFAFSWGALSDAAKTVAFGGTNATAEAKLNWLRGSRTDETPNGLRFRKRNVNSIMGPVVSSNPTVTSPPSADYFGTRFPGYGSFVTTYRNRKSIVWVGAGDGMLHGFNAATSSSTGGTPIISYVPQLLHSRLQDWVDPAGEKVQAFQDGTPYSADVLLGSTITNTGDPAYDAAVPTAAWRTYLFASLGRGGKGIFALDVTDPDALTETNAASVFKWQFSEADDSSGDLGYNLAQMGTISRVSEQSGAIAKMNNGKFAVLMPNGINSTNGSAALYILFANGPYSGVWSPSTNYVKLVADVGPNNGLSQATWIDTNNDGVADYIYAGDLKGNLWKFDVSSSNQANWKVAYANADGTNKRPLFIAKQSDASALRLPITSAPEYRFHPLGGVVINFATGKSVVSSDFPDGSGRNHTIFGIWDNPLYSSAAYVTNPALLDNATTGLPRLRTQLTARTFNRITVEDSDPTNGIVGEGYVTGSAMDWTTKKGWYVTLPDTSEMVVSNPTITQGLLATVSIAPAATSADICFSGPVAYATFLDPITGLLDSNVFGTITIGGVTYRTASIRITDQRVTFSRDATNTACAAGQQNCTRIIGETTDETAQSPNTSARIYWREIPSFKTR
jgi:type IV pilus assembly protein PilY1